MASRRRVTRPTRRTARAVPWRALAGGVAGASALTLIHESVRRFEPAAPRMDVLGMRALATGLGPVLERVAGRPVPPHDTLHTLALLGDLVGNSLYYSLAAAPTRRETWRRGALLGLAAGLGAVVLPPRLGLGGQPSGRTPATKFMTVTWYLAGGLAAAAASSLLSRDGRP